jgi:plasmid stabilization system protein ParE
LEEFKSAVAWYLERNETAANKFVAEIDRAIDLVIQSPQRWPVGEHAVRAAAVSIRSDIPRKRDGR